MKFERSLYVILAFAICLAVSACAPQATAPVTSGPTTQVPPASVAAPAWPARIQALYAGVKADAAAWVVVHPKDALAIAAAEKALDGEVAGLTGDVPPTSLAGVVTDIQNAINGLPAGVISPGRKLEIDLALSALQVGGGFLGFSAVAAPVAPVIAWELAP
jgi:hypothetical protein